MALEQGLHMPVREKRAIDPKTGEWTPTWLGVMQGLGQSYGSMNTVDHVAGDFTGSGAMTWTVASADLVSFAYLLMGKLLIVFLTIRQSSVGGVVDASLQVALPGTDASGAALVAARDGAVPVWIDDNGTKAIGVARFTALSNVLKIEKVNGANWTAAANTTGVEGVIPVGVA